MSNTKQEIMTCRNCKSESLFGEVTSCPGCGMEVKYGRSLKEMAGVSAFIAALLGMTVNGALGSTIAIIIAVIFFGWHFYTWWGMRNLYAEIGDSKAYGSSPFSALFAKLLSSSSKGGDRELKVYMKAGVDTPTSANETATAAPKETATAAPKETAKETDTYVYKGSVRGTKASAIANVHGNYIHAGSTRGTEASAVANVHGNYIHAGSTRGTEASAVANIHGQHIYKGSTRGTEASAIAIVDGDIISGAAAAVVLLVL